MGTCWGKFWGPGADVHSATSGETKPKGSVVHSHSIQSITSSESGTASDNGLATPRPRGQILPVGNLKVFTFNDLKNATRNFRPDSLLGQGGFGCVFKGWVDELQGYIATRPGTGTVIAVKKLNNESMQGKKEWLAEVNYLGQLSHPNLVKLIGYCCEDENLLLVYEFMPKGSLENHLFRRGNYHQPLPWNLRIKIALGAARGLEFLHLAKPQVIYRDFKTSNILLDSTYNAKLSDFGLATDGPTGTKSHVTTRVMGTYGYAAPEYMATGHLTSRSDVYGFGVVLLEIISGMRALDSNRPPGQQKLVEWAKPYLSDKRKLHRVMDQRLDGQYPIKAAYKASNLALQCLSTEAKQRPLMSDVVEKLEAIYSIKVRPIQDERSRPVRSAVAANGRRNAQGHPHHVMTYQSPSHPNGSASPLHSYARSPRQR